MKKTLLLLFVAAIAATASAQQYTIKGHAPSFAKKVYLAPAGEETVDSTMVAKDGSFSFQGDAQGKHIAFIATDGEEPARHVVFLEGHINVDLEKLTASGGKENEGLNDYVSYTTQLTEPLKALAAQLSAKAESGQQLGQEEMMAFYGMLEGIQDTIMVRNKHDLEAYKDMRWPAFIVLESLSEFEKDYLIQLDNPQNAFMSEPCLDKAHELIQAYRRTKEGAHFADFEMADTAGVMHKLSEYVGQGKYVLIDFWATWCGPCMRELPNVKAIYEKYHDKGFDIVGVSFDEDGEAWRAVIKRRGMNWIHLSDLKGWKSLPVSFYGVQAIPHTMLVGPDGTIIANGLNSEELDAKLAEIFK